MKLKKNSIQQQISKQPWVNCPDGFAASELIQQQIYKAEQEAYLKRPNPPTPEAIKKAQFVDKTYVWSGQ